MVDLSSSFCYQYSNKVVLSFKFANSGGLCIALLSLYEAKHFEGKCVGKKAKLTELIPLTSKDICCTPII